MAGVKTNSSLLTIADMHPCLGMCCVSAVCRMQPVMLYWCSGLRGLTIVDSFDTLHIMGLTEEAKKAQEFLLSDQLNFNQV